MFCDQDQYKMLRAVYAFKTSMALFLGVGHYMTVNSVFGEVGDEAIMTFETPSLGDYTFFRFNFHMNGDDDVLQVIHDEFICAPKGSVLCVLIGVICSLKRSALCVLIRAIFPLNAVPCV